jgi:hypothetical protein
LAPPSWAASPLLRKPLPRSDTASRISFKIFLTVEPELDGPAAWRHIRSQTLLAPIAAPARAQLSLPERDHTEERRAFLVPTNKLDTARAAMANLTNIPDVFRR